MGLSIGAKLTLAFFLILLFVFVLGVYSLISTQQELRKAVGQGSVFLAEDTIERIDEDILLKVEALQLYSKDFFLQEALKESNAAAKELETTSTSSLRIQVQEFAEQEESELVSDSAEVIRAMAQKQIAESLQEEFVKFWEKKYGVSVYQEAFVANKYGIIIAQTEKTLEYYQGDKDWWHKTETRGFHIDAITYDESAKEWVMPISVRVDDSEGNFLGMIQAAPLVRELVREVQLTAKKYETTEIKLMTTDGQLIYSTKAFQIFEDISNEEFFKNIEDGNGFFIAQGKGGKEKLFAYAHSRGIRNFEGLGWTLVIGHDTAEVFAPIQKLQNVFVVTSALLLVLIGFLAITLTRAISNPIKTLTSAAERISTGNLSVKIDIESKDEIGQLAASFNRMAVQLQRSHANLEAQVRERTVELDQTAKVLVRRDLELSEKNERLRDLDEIKSQFVSVAAHQLRTPLSGIKWTLYALLEEQVGKLNAEQRKFAQDSYTATIRLIDLVNDLLNVSRIEEGRFGFNMERKDFVHIVQKVYKRFKDMAKNKGIDFSLYLPKEKLPLLDIDEEKIGIALENFIENAIKYTSPAGIVSVTVKEENERISVVISDTGIGIPKDQTSRVFKKFFRAKNAQLFQTSGTGLGLYVSKNIIQNHDGEVYFTTEENKGSVFTFTLPIPKKKINRKERDKNN